MSINSLEDLTKYIQKILNLNEPISADENLIIYGLDSLTVMQLSANLKKEGITLEYTDLINKPTLNEWWHLIKNHYTNIGKKDV